jgi:SAM-dependent methyltransferase
MQKSRKSVVELIPSLRDTYRFVIRHGWVFPFRAVHWLIDIMYEIQFDRRYNVKTAFIILPDKLNYENPDIQKQAVQYQPSPAYTILKGLKVFKKVCSFDFKDATFIDYGCGAGRVMIIAAEYGFKKIIGVELSPYLVELCQNNIKTYSHSHKNCNLTVVKQNAAEYIPPSDANVFFFYSPFGFDIYKQVISNIKASVNRNHRTIYVLEILSEIRNVDFAKEGFEFERKVGKLRILRYQS